MNKLLLDYAITKNFKEIDELTEVVGCKEKNVDNLKIAIDSFINRLTKGIPVKLLLIKLLEVCYDINYSNLRKKTINELLYLVSLSSNNIKEQFYRLKEKANNHEYFDMSFNEIINIPNENIDNLLELFKLLGDIIKKSGIVQTEALEKELQNWSKRRTFYTNTSKTQTKKNNRKYFNSALVLFTALVLILGLILIIVKHISSQD